MHKAKITVFAFLFTYAQVPLPFAWLRCIAALATADHVDMTFSHLFPSAESAVVAVNFRSIYNSTRSPDRIATADEIALVDDDDLRSQ